MQTLQSHLCQQHSHRCHSAIANHQPRNLPQRRWDYLALWLLLPKAASLIILTLHWPCTKNLWITLEPQHWSMTMIPGLVEVTCFWFSACGSNGEGIAVSSCFFCACVPIFSTAGKIFRPERTRLTEEKFEQLVFIKCNKRIHRHITGYWDVEIEMTFEVLTANLLTNKSISADGQ